MRTNTLPLLLLTLAACDAGMERWAPEPVPEAKQAAAQRAEDLGLVRRDFEIFHWNVSDGLAMGVDRVAVGVTSHSCSGVAIAYLDDLLDGYRDARQTLDTCKLGGSSFHFDEEVALGDGVLVAAERIFRDTGAGYVEESVAASLPRDVVIHNLVVDADTVLLGYRSGLLVLTHSMGGWYEEAWLPMELLGNPLVQVGDRIVVQGHVLRRDGGRWELIEDVFPGTMPIHGDGELVLIDGWTEREVVSWDGIAWTDEASFPSHSMDHVYRDGVAQVDKGFFRTFGLDGRYRDEMYLGGSSVRVRDVQRGHVLAQLGDTFHWYTPVGTGSSEALLEQTLTLKAGDEHRVKVDVPKTGNLTVSIEGTGDADLYVQQGAHVAKNDYACRPYTATSQEACSFDSPDAGTWSVLVHGYEASDVTLTVTVR